MINLTGSNPSSTHFILLILLILLHISIYLSYVDRFGSQLQRRTRSSSKKFFSVRDFGAVGNGINDDTQAFRDAWKKACSLSLKTLVLVPAGYTYLVHPIGFSGSCKSKVTLKISGTIVAPSNPDAWNGLNPRKWLYFHGVKHLTMEGGGKINGMGHEWWAQSCKINMTTPCQPAPTAITFHNCTDLKIRNLKIINSQKMHIAFNSCKRVVASSLQVFAPQTSPNTDGIHISTSAGVEIKNCLIRTGDDCISIVGNSSRIRIRNLECGPGHGIRIGSLGKSSNWEEVHDIMVDRAILSNTDNGLRIKTWQGGSGSVSRITFQNVLMENVSHPISIDQYYCDSLFPCLNQTLAVKVENVSFIGIKGTSASKKAVRFACSDDSPCKALYLQDVHLISSSDKNTKSFCWQAEVSNLGRVYPQPMAEPYRSSHGPWELIIKPKISASSYVQSF